MKPYKIVQQAAFVTKKSDEETGVSSEGQNISVTTRIRGGSRGQMLV